MQTNKRSWEILGANLVDVIYHSQRVNSSAEIADLTNEPPKKISARGKYHGKWFLWLHLTGDFKFC